MTTLAAALLARLRQHGVDMVFGIPGVHTAELYRGLEGSGIRHITPRHEQGAGFMADGYARASGKPGVCLVITGPGLSNIATAMLQARGDSVPMLVISGVNDPQTKAEGRLHEMPDQTAFAAQCAVSTRTIADAGQLAEAIDEAFNIFSSRRPGPVHIQIPLSMMNAACDMATSQPARRHELLSGDVGTAAKLLAAARAPIMIVGGGARHAAGKALALAEALDCPLAPTIHARQGFAQGHPLIVPASLSFDDIRNVLEQSDAVLALGTEFGATDYDVYATGYRLSLRNLIRVDIDADQLAHGPAATVALQGDAEDAADTLLRAIPPRQRRDGAQRAEELRAFCWKALGPLYQRYVSLLESMRDLAPETIFVGDSTQLVYAGNMYFAPGAGGGWFNSSSGFGTLGFALPAAIGAKLAQPDRPVVALVGDGGAQFTLGEFGSLADSGVKVIVIVWNNRGYGEIRSYMSERKITPQGVDLSPPDYVLIAQAYGLRAIVADGEDALLPAYREALGHDGAVVIEVRNVS